MAGPISFFSKSEKNKRQYRKSEELRTAQQDYLDVIRSDSMRNELITHFSLSREKYDSLLILFNDNWGALTIPLAVTFVLMGLLRPVFAWDGRPWAQQA